MKELLQSRAELYTLNDELYRLSQTAVLSAKPNEEKPSILSCHMLEWKAPLFRQ